LRGLAHLERAFSLRLPTTSGALMVIIITTTNTSSTREIIKPLLGCKALWAGKELERPLASQSQAAAIFPTHWACIAAREAPHCTARDLARLIVALNA